ncbi:MAG: ORF6N domain-containing protein [Clostridium sp.]
MDKDIIKIGSKDLQVKQYKGQRVVTFKDVDMVHERVKGTARRNFNENKEHFIKNVDYFKVCADEIRTHKIIDISNKAREDITFLTETGYLMLVKSLQDDLAWEVQRELVNRYFRVDNSRKVISEIKGQLITIINDLLDEKLSEAREYYKINSKSKVDISTYIKKRLGILRADDEYEQVKARVFLLLGITKWEDLNLESYNKILPVIDESIRVIKAERPYEQMSFY